MMAFCLTKVTIGTSKVGGVARAFDEGATLSDDVLEELGAGVEERCAVVGPGVRVGLACESGVVAQLGRMLGRCVTGCARGVSGGACGQCWR